MVSEVPGHALHEALISGASTTATPSSALEDTVARGDDLERLVNRDEEQLGTGSAGNASQGTGRVSWQMMTFILLGDMFGLGTLTLPADFARLGWILALVLMSICFLGTLYSGRLFTLLAEQVPSARVFDDFGKSAMGRSGQRLVYLTVYGTILMNPIIFQLTSVESLQQMFYRSSLSSVALGGIVAGLMLPLSQMQGLEDVAALSAIGTVGMVVAVAVAVGKLCAMDGPIKHTELIHKPSDLTSPIVALLDIVFTYGGQVNWVRYITQMRIRRHFPRSVVVTSVVMTLGYLVMGAAGYIRLGTEFDLQKPITSVLPHDRLWTPIMNAGLFAHCILAYQINLNVWTDLVLHLVSPLTGWPEEKLRNPGWLTWGSVSVSGIAIAFIVAAAFPFFSTVAAIIASLGDLAGAYALPAIFLLTLAGASLAPWERGLLRCIIPITLALSALGLICSVRTLVLEFIHT